MLEKNQVMEEIMEELEGADMRVLRMVLAFVRGLMQREGM